MERNPQGRQQTGIGNDWKQKEKKIRQRMTNELEGEEEEKQEEIKSGKAIKELKRKRGK